MRIAQAYCHQNHRSFLNANHISVIFNTSISSVDSSVIGLQKSCDTPEGATREAPIISVNSFVIHLPYPRDTLSRCAFGLRYLQQHDLSQMARFASLARRKSTLSPTTLYDLSKEMMNWLKACHLHHRIFWLSYSLIPVHVLFLRHKISRTIS